MIMVKQTVLKTFKPQMPPVEALLRNDTQSLKVLFSVILLRCYMIAVSRSPTVSVFKWRHPFAYKCQFMPFEE